MNPFLELKNTGNVKDIDARSRKVSGYLSSFGNIDTDNDIIVRGAFAKSIRERKDKIFFLLQHNWEKPLGKFQKLEEDDKGLYFEAEIANTSYGNDLIELYAAGIINEHSIGFNTVKSETDKATGVRTIKEVKLWEGSAVSLAANPATPFTGFKSELKDLQEKQSKLIKAIKEGNFTDETFVMLEYSLKALMAEAYELSTQQGTEPAEATPQVLIEPQDIKSIFNNFKI